MFYRTQSYKPFILDFNKNFSDRILFLGVLAPIVIPVYFYSPLFSFISQGLIELSLT
jgi:hypothetical protein